MNMIEKVARAIYDRYGFRCSIGPNCPQCKMNDMESRGKAKAAILAMREPSEGMVEEGDESLDWHSSNLNANYHDGDAKKSWQAMIDAALAE